MTALLWSSRLLQTFSTKSHFTSSTFSSVKTWLPKVTTFSFRILKPSLSPNVAMLLFMLNWWTTGLERYCVTRLYVLIRTLRSSWLTSRMERSCGRILLTFWRPVRRIKCSDIRFQGLSVMESTKRWVWWIQCRKHRKKLLSYFTNRNKTKTSKLTKNLTTHHSWQLASTYKKTCKINLLWTRTTNKSKPHNSKCSSPLQPNSSSIPIKATWTFWRWRSTTWLETRKILLRSCPGTWFVTGRFSRAISTW